MNIIELLPTYDKVEVYPKYRTYEWSNPRSGNEYDYEFDLHIIYFERFVILRDVPSNHSKEAFQENPIFIPRVFFDKVHPLNDGLTKAKRFLVFKENGFFETPGDLVDRGNWNIENINNRGSHLRNLLNTALGKRFSQDNSYTHEQKHSLSTLMEMLTTVNKFLTDFPSSEPQQYMFRRADCQDNYSYTRHKQTHLRECKLKGESYFEAIKNQEVILTPQEFEVAYQDYLDSLNNDDNDVNDNDEAEFGYFAGLVADGELNPNDPRWPF